MFMTIPSEHYFEQRGKGLWFTPFLFIQTLKGVMAPLSQNYTSVFVF